jgi:hypothetical protein
LDFDGYTTARVGETRARELDGRAISIQS